MFVVSDFTRCFHWQRHSDSWPQRHDVVAVRLLDPLELELPDRPGHRCATPKSGEQLQVTHTTWVFAAALPSWPLTAAPRCAKA